MGNRKGPRHKIRRDLKQAIANMETAQTYLVRSGKQFEGDYPLLYDHACALVTALEAVIKTVDAFRDEI